MGDKEPSSGADSSASTGGPSLPWAASVLGRFAIVHGAEAAQMVWDRAAAGLTSDNPSADQLRQSIGHFLKEATTALLAEHEDLGSCEITSEPLPIPES